MAALDAAYCIEKASEVLASEESASSSNDGSHELA